MNPFFNRRDAETQSQENGISLRLSASAVNSNP